MRLTLTQLKRDLILGTSVTLVDAPTMPNHKYLGVPRFVVHVQGNGVALSPDKNAIKGSFLDFPKASLCEYVQDTVNPSVRWLKIYAIGKRPLSAQEQAVIDGMPSYQECNHAQAERDALSDGVTTYWMDKRYTKALDADWYWKTSKGLRYDHNDKMMFDDNCKGSLELMYKILIA